jgi:hypothetical protein
MGSAALKMIERSIKNNGKTVLAKPLLPVNRKYIAGQTIEQNRWSGKESKVWWDKFSLPLPPFAERQVRYKPTQYFQLYREERLYSGESPATPGSGESSGSGTSENGDAPVDRRSGLIKPTLVQKSDGV